MMVFLENVSLCQDLVFSRWDGGVLSTAKQGRFSNPCCQANLSIYS